MSVNLRFSAAPQTGPTWHLLFGATETQAPLSIAIDLGSPTVAISALLDTVTVSAYCAATWQEASRIAPPPARLPWSYLSQSSRVTSTPWSDASATPSRAASRWVQSLLMPRRISKPWRDGVGVVTFPKFPWQQAAISPQRISEATWHDGVFNDANFTLPWVQALLRGRTVAMPSQTARLFPRITVIPWSDGRQRRHYNREPWQDGVRQVSYGIPWSPDVTLPPEHVCYTPNTHLLFSQPPVTDGHLLFVCTNDPPAPGTVVVPIKRVYIVINDVTLRRVEGNVFLPVLSLNLSIDVDSWTWGFSASLPGQSLNDVKSDDGEPVELEASINGNTYRLLAENLSRSREWNRSTLTVTGRGKNAILAAPYAPVLTFANSTDRTAQQLMSDVLTLNGESLGWDIDWQLEDWLVGASLFNVNGSYIDGLNAIVGAAGAYLQPHPTAKEMSALLRYPVAPWNWAADVTPDFELPSAVTTQEAIEWVKKPEYNRVFISGQQGGKLVRVTIEGTAGDIVAPMVTDALTTTVVPGRQRGLSILGDTGRQAAVTLRLPVLEETGIITPGKFVRYVDGSDEKLGIVRGVSVDASLPEVWQSIQVETHE